MSNCCYTCKKKFTVLNLDRKRCKECDQYFCYNCVSVPIVVIGTYCKVCKILNTRPPNQNSVSLLRARDIKTYLTKRKIQTDSCIEKEDLIKCFFKYVQLEPQLKNKRSNVNFRAAYTSNTRYSSTPNLAGANRERPESENVHTPPARTPRSSAGPNDGPDENLGASSSAYIHTESQTSSAAFTQANVDTAENGTNTSAFNEDPHTEEKMSNRSHMKISSIQELKDIQDLTIKQLKELLTINRVDFKGCVEKDELRNKVTQLWKAQQTRPDVSNLPQDELCKICMDAPLNSVLLECGHIVSCIDCGKQLAECPICRQYVVRVVHTFKA